MKIGFFWRERKEERAGVDSVEREDLHLVVGNLNILVANLD